MNREKVLQYFLAHRDEVDARVNAGIETHRKGDFTLTFGNRKTKHVRIRQTGHAFRFGCNAFMIGCFETPEKEKIYREKFAKVFNLGVVPFYWSDLEPTEGHLRFHADAEFIYRRPAPDLVLDFCREYDIEPKGHCLVWNHFVPNWLASYSETDKRRILERRFSQIAAEYADKIPSFDIINESASNYYYGLGTLFPDYPEYGLDLGATYFPNNRKILNETNQALWDAARSGKYNPFVVQVRDLLAAGKKIDTLGLQYHLFKTESQIEEESTLRSYLDPMIMFDLLDRVNAFGLPMQISEISIPSYFQTTAENEEIQAELLRELYRLWFSIENMSGIVWWNLADGYAAYCTPNTNGGENYFGAGLLDYSMREKPAYRELDRLINHEWKTELEVEGAETSVAFRGFFGTYEITVTEDGKETVFTVDLTKDSPIAAIGG